MMLLHQAPRCPVVAFCIEYPWTVALARSSNRVRFTMHRHTARSHRVCTLRCELVRAGPQALRSTACTNRRRGGAHASASGSSSSPLVLASSTAAFHVTPPLRSFPHPAHAPRRSTSSPFPVRARALATHPSPCSSPRDRFRQRTPRMRHAACVRNPVVSCDLRHRSALVPACKPRPSPLLKFLGGISSMRATRLHCVQVATSEKTAASAADPPCSQQPRCVAPNALILGAGQSSAIVPARVREHAAVRRSRYPALLFLRGTSALHDASISSMCMSRARPTREHTAVSPVSFLELPLVPLALLPRTSPTPIAPPFPSQRRRARLCLSSFSRPGRPFPWSPQLRSFTSCMPRAALRSHPQAPSRQLSVKTDSSPRETARAAPPARVSPLRATSAVRAPPLTHVSGTG
ncbi:hypothetical protein B0H15DRAFT_869960, partial [Mycena belliarum]